MKRNWFRCWWVVMAAAMAAGCAWAQGSGNSLGRARLTGRVMPVERLAARPGAADVIGNPEKGSSENGEAAVGGWKFMTMCDTTDFWPREELMVKTVLAGNVPDSLRVLHEIEFVTPVVDSVEVLRVPHRVALWVSCDYIAVGTDADFVRMPMGPLAAQAISDSLNCILPTPFIVDRINDVAQGALDIFPFRPVGGRNSLPYVFQDSNNAINALMKAKGYHWGMFVSGLKKDIVISCKLKEPQWRKSVGIYGWHHPDGRAQQPLYVRHGNFYVDYSHGVRLVSRRCTVDGREMDVKTILESPELFRLLSTEPAPIVPARYDRY
mgnify:FL=1